MVTHDEGIAYCHACGGAMSVETLPPFSNVECPACGKHTRVKREFGPYTLTRRHAIGGMSLVFVAHDNSLDREVALKILNEDHTADARRMAAFEEEARLTASLSHPHIVRVLTTGWAFGRLYIAMELVPGGHLEHRIKELGKIPQSEMLPLAIQVAQGLKAAHSAGLLHRDIKPGNILLDARGNAKIVDFGLALVTQGGKATASEFWATPYYVPPETVEGTEEDFRADMYAFGASLYHALSGVPPCNQETMATDILREAKQRVIPLHRTDPSLDPDVCEIVDRAMAYQPADRFSSYDELIAALQAAQKRIASGVGADNTRVLRQRQARRRKIQIATWAAAVALVILAAVVLLPSKPEPAPPPLTDQGPEAAEPALATPADPLDAPLDAGRRYAEARMLMGERNFEAAARCFARLLASEEVGEPTRSWAGVEAVVCHWLDGSAQEAREAASRASRHIASLEAPEPQLVSEIRPLLDAMPQYGPPSGLMDPPPSLTGESSIGTLIRTLLAGLVLWEQGMIDASLPWFRRAAEFPLAADDAVHAIYPELARDYLADAEILLGPLFSSAPESASDCSTRLEELDAALSTLRTSGRARFNLRAWQWDLQQRVRRLDRDAPADNPEPSPPLPTPPVADPNAATLAGLLAEFRFLEARAKLDAANDLSANERAAMISLTESAAVFLEDLARDLARLQQPAPVALELRSAAAGPVRAAGSGEPGEIILETPEGRQSLPWNALTADSLIALHRHFTSSPLADLERMRRHECAIAFDWLAGDPQRAAAAAQRLATESPAFRSRWTGLSATQPPRP